MLPTRRHKRGRSNSRPYKTYKLTGKIQVNSGATLTIPAGTTIEGTGGTSSYIAIPKVVN
jgi:hypothetical protein